MASDKNGYQDQQHAKNVNLISVCINPILHTRHYKYTIIGIPIQYSKEHKDMVTGSLTTDTWTYISQKPGR